MGMGNDRPANRISSNNRKPCRRMLDLYIHFSEIGMRNSQSPGRTASPLTGALRHGLFRLTSYPADAPLWTAVAAAPFFPGTAYLRPSKERPNWGALSAS
jgi:hypothetical protein